MIRRFAGGCNRRRIRGRRWSGLLGIRELGWITSVDAGFVQLVQQTAALAKRQNDLIGQHQDEAAMNRESLEHFNHLWQGADRYLNQ